MHALLIFTELMKSGTIDIFELSQLSINWYMYEKILKVSSSDKENLVAISSAVFWA